MEVTRADGRVEIIKYPDKKIINPSGVVQHYRSCIIDTISAPQNFLYKKINQDKSTNYDQWKDFGWEIYNLYDEIKKMPDTLIVQILGIEGTGKTVGGKFLNPAENGWINADNKPLSFMGARQMYPEDKSKKNYSLAESYDEVLAAVKAMHEKRKGIFIVFILGHLEIYKGPRDLMYQRLKILGKQATKLGIEGLNVFATYYTKIIDGKMPNDPTKYRLAVSTSGFDTARTPEGYHDEIDIPNNYQLIVDKILEDYGELKPIS